MKKLFGTDGIRGKAGEFPLDAATVATIGRSLSRKFREQLGRAPRIVTGRDTRESGGWIERAFHAGSLAEEAECRSAGIITTPGVAFITKHFEFDAGVPREVTVDWTPAEDMQSSPGEDNSLDWGPRDAASYEGPAYADSLTAPVEPGLYVLAVFVLFPEGDVTYGFYIEVR